MTDSGRWQAISMTLTCLAENVEKNTHQALHHEDGVHCYAFEQVKLNIGY